MLQPGQDVTLSFASKAVHFFDSETGAADRLKTWVQATIRLVHWIGTSWKMNKTLAEALAFAEALAAALPEVDSIIQPFVIPPFTAARQVKAALANTRVKVGAQNMHWDDAGRLDRRNLPADAERLRSRSGRTRPQ